MNPDDWHKKYDQLYEQVKRMRGWQKEYLKYHIGSDRETMKIMERKVDNMLKEETDLRKKNLKELF